MNEFETAVLDGVKDLTTKHKSLADKQAEIFQDVSRMSGELKDALNDMGKVKDNANDMSKVIAKVQRELAAMIRANYHDPMDRFLASEERREWLVGCFRKAAGLPLTPIQRTSIGASDSSLGAAATPQETNEAIYDTLLTYGQWNTLGVTPIGSKTQIIPIGSTRPTAYWLLNEGGGSPSQPTEGAVTGTSVTLTVKECVAWIPIARGFLEDSSPAAVRWIIDALMEAVAYRLDWACFPADGTSDSTDGGYTGIAYGGTAAGAAAGNSTVSLLDLDDWVKCLTTVNPAVLQRAAKWWIHPQILAKVALVKDLNGRPIFQNALEAPSNTVGSILGYPVIPTAAMPSTDSATNTVAVFGDPQGCAVGVARNFELASSEHFRFDYNQMSYRTSVRAGVIIKQALAFARLVLTA